MRSTARVLYRLFSSWTFISRVYVSFGEYKCALPTEMEIERASGLLFLLLRFVLYTLLLRYTKFFSSNKISENNRLKFFSRRSENHQFFRNYFNFAESFSQAHKFYFQAFRMEDRSFTRLFTALFNFFLAYSWKLKDWNFIFKDNNKIFPKMIKLLLFFGSLPRNNKIWNYLIHFF